MKQQRGGTILGFIIGVVVGLAVALGVAVYVTKVPVPFMNKGQTRSADQDAEEAKKNKDWDPNAPLYGKNPVKPPQPAASGPVTPAAPVASAPAAPTKPEAKAPDAKASDAKAADAKKPEAKAAASADPIGELAKAKTAAADAEPFVYWVQVGAYRTAEDAESQRAKLSLSGIETKISEREQSGRTVYRVRVGPFDKKEDGEKTKEKLDKAGLDTALVRVQR
ncbi:SPOR domain-containing protein [Rhodoferax sp. GW822-FHT02A01]|uniref:SPOR domain-containing protein n=1 Tax=Rhodoferax sp. GW822-FHT02A01 TaxID=3141537 RepID=UPI00315D20E6